MLSFSLLDYFSYFRPDNPYQLSAIQALQDALPEELKREDAEWRETWAVSGIEQWVLTPYYLQLDNPVQPLRECFTSSAAMVLAKYKKVSDDVEYAWRLKSFGDTTSIQAQLKGIRSYGLSAEFSDKGTPNQRELEIQAGKPVMVGWLHHGTIDAPYGFGHWSVIVGYNNDEFIMHDPAGAPDMIHGGHTRESGKNIRINRKEFLARWQIEGKASGWLITVEDS